MRASGLLLALMCTLAAPGTVGAAGQYYVDPVKGTDTPTAGSERAPWKTVSYAAAQLGDMPPDAQAGVVLNVRASAIHPPMSLPPTLRGTATQPVVIQPYDGDRVVFDAGEPRFHQPGAWEPVPGQVDEWRTKDPFDTNAGDEVAWGEVTDGRFRLITYSSLENLRAANESYARVPLLDPRPGRPLDSTHKQLYAYIGPGLFYVLEGKYLLNGRERWIGRPHLRLSSTHIDAPGIEDYVGGGDPNTMNLAVSRSGAVAGQIHAQHVVLKNLVFQNGGLSTLKFGPGARDVTLDHCEVRGGRYVVRMPGGIAGIRFHHCTFDGALAPWTSRTDVKDSVGSMTHDVLVIHAASQSEYVNCTFRRAHDAIGLTGDQIEIRDSLFEDINDEVFQYNNNVTNVRIHGNVVRQALMVNSFHTNPTGGPIYFYRNLVDQRVPTRGYRVLPPDAPAPLIWRWGSDFKNGETPTFHVYQNTFLSSHSDKGSYVSQQFYSDPTQPRTYLNNIHLVLNLDRTLSRVPSDTSPARADGNVWYRFHVDPSPVFQQPMFLSTTGAYFTFEQLWAAFPAWEAQGQYADPQLANFTDEYFDYASGYPNTDVRPAAGEPAHGRGVVLPAELPEDFVSGGAPDVGARPVGAPVMAVGVDAATLYPAPGVPVAIAGSDQTIVDADGDGFELIALDGSASSDPDGSIVSHAWSTEGSPVASGAAPILDLPEGDHYLRLVVTDDAGKVDSDAVRVRIVAPVPGENVLECPGFEETPCGWQLGGGAILTGKGAHSGRRAVTMAPNGLTPTVRQRVPISRGRYTVSGWLATDLVFGSAALVYNVLDADGAVLLSRAFARKIGDSPYSYHEATVDPVKGAAFIEVVGVVAGTGSGTAHFDDFRVKDRNLLHNGRFEQRSPTGREDAAPGWSFVRGGIVVDDPGDVRSGRRALALVPYGNYHLITQEILHTNPGGYRVSAWLKTTGLATVPTLNVRFRGPAGQNLGLRAIAATTSEGGYSLVSGDLLPGNIPAGTAALSLQIGLAEVAEGTAFFDDVMVEPLP